MGFSPRKGEPFPLIPREEWEEEFTRMNTEEAEWWKNAELVAAQLAVELPFWLMLPDGDISLSYEEATVNATIHGHYLEVSEGPMSLPSRNNAVLIGPGNEVLARDLPESIVPSRKPVYRPMKTVVTFPTEVASDAFVAWKGRKAIASDDRTAIRRMNRAIHYLTTLATAYIPFLNVLITSYRSTSFDPYAFEVSQWDVPVWFAIRDDTFIRIGLMPYWNSDTYPSVNRAGKSQPYAATSLKEVQAQAATRVAPGKLELLDAYSLMYRGRFGDAVRSAVTGIEVAVEDQLTKLWQQRGVLLEEIEERLKESRNNFFERIEEYERLSQRRLPGPLLSEFPHINGIRLRSELDWVRSLRHRVVHDGIRVDVLDPGPMQRAIETMSWLFDWLSSEDEHGPGTSENYTLFSMLRGGQVRYPFEYVNSGVRVRPASVPDDNILSTTDQFRRQFIETTEPEVSDIELLALMSFEYLRVTYKDGPPQPSEEPRLRERFVIHDGERNALVFCCEFDDLIDASTVRAIATRVLNYRRDGGICHSALAIIHHQRHLPKGRRIVDAVIPDDMQGILDACGVTTITALDLQMLVRGVLELGWPGAAIGDLLFASGRQGKVPPTHTLIGRYRKLFPKQSAISIELEEQQTVLIGDTIAFRLADRYFEEIVESLELQGQSVESASGPCRVGVKTKLGKSDLKAGQPVFLRGR
jgi:hypothetical protein